MKSDTKQFLNQVNNSVSNSISKVYNHGESSIPFLPFTSEHQQFLDELRERKFKEDSSGLSGTLNWISGAASKILNIKY
jgi:hypothetical protein